MTRLLFHPHRLLVCAAAAAWIYPVVLIASAFACWGIAWAALGHPPIPFQNDPKSINAWVDASYYSTMLMISGFPAAALAGLMLTNWCILVSGGRRVLKAVAGTAAFSALWVCAIAVLRSDPCSITSWLFD